MALVQNWPLFPSFLLGDIGQETVFYDILERKIAFVVYKIKKFIMSMGLVKNWQFFHVLISLL